MQSCPLVSIHLPPGDTTNFLMSIECWNFGWIQSHLIHHHESCIMHLWQCTQKLSFKLDQNSPNNVVSTISVLYRYLTSLLSMASSVVCYRNWYVLSKIPLWLCLQHAHFETAEDTGHCLKKPNFEELLPFHYCTSRIFFCIFAWVTMFYGQNYPVCCVCSSCDNCQCPSECQSLSSTRGQYPATYPYFLFLLHTQVTTFAWSSHSRKETVISDRI